MYIYIYTDTYIVCYVYIYIVYYILYIYKYVYDFLARDIHVGREIPPTRLGFRCFFEWPSEKVPSPKNKVLLGESRKTGSKVLYI